MKSTLIILVLLGFWSCQPDKEQEEKMNVLFISIDDLNDWVEVLDGYPGVHTPNIDQLASQSTLFRAAYTAAPLCNPSRTAILTGIHPYTSGIYKNKQLLRSSEKLETAYTLPQYFRQNGYKTMGSGKVFHYSYDTVSWDDYWPSLQKIRPDDPGPDEKPMHGMPMYSRFFDWGPIEAEPAEMGDWKVADWVSKQLEAEHDQPFFLACGFYKPHLPWYIPKKYFDLYPLDKITLPKVDSNDLADVPQAGRHLAKVKVLEPDVSADSLEGDHLRVLRYNKWKEGVQAYLAAISFVDECLGKVLDALENSKYHKNTMIVLWSDHGYHLGEKLHWRKSTLWEEATRSLLMFRAPGITEAGTLVNWPVSLVDIYPTLLEICQLPENDQLEGRSLFPLLEDAALEWDYPVVTTFGYKNQSVRSKRWRYIRYADDTEELYDHQADPLEWNNLAKDPQHKNTRLELAQFLPKEHTPPIQQNNKK